MDAPAHVLPDLREATVDRFREVAAADRIAGRRGVRARAGAVRFLFLALPLRIVGGSGSPLRPVALFPRPGPPSSSSPASESLS